MVAQLMPLPHPILGAISSAREAVAEVREVQPLFMIPAEQTAAVTAIAGLEAVLADLKLRVLAASGETAAAAGARDVGAWYGHLTRTDPPVAGAEARLAAALDRRWTAVAAGMAAGVVSTAQARVVVDALEALPDHIGSDIVAKAEAQMVAYCADLRPDQLRRLGHHLLEVVAPEIAEAELAKKLEDEEQQAREKTSLRSRIIGGGLARTTILHPVASRDRLHTYLESFTSPRNQDGAIGGEEDRIPHTRQLGQAFCALLEHLDPAKLPQHGGDATTLMVTIDLDSLRQELGTGAIVGGDPLSATAVRRLACNANIIPVVLGAKGEILDLGRTRRLHPPHIRRAIRLRDQRCRAEGCTVPAAWCEVHHLKPWSQGGKTNLADGILGCSFHHHRFHDPSFGYDLLPSGDIRFHRRR